MVYQTEFGVWITKTRKPAKNAKREDAKKVRPATNPFVFFALRALRPLRVFVIQTSFTTEHRPAHRQVGGE
jgi:hypothetical protein